MFYTIFLMVWEICSGEKVPMYINKESLLKNIGSVMVLLLCISSDRHLHVSTAEKWNQYLFRLWSYAPDKVGTEVQTKWWTDRRTHIFTICFPSPAVAAVFVLLCHFPFLRLPFFPFFLFQILLSAYRELGLNSKSTVK